MALKLMYITNDVKIAKIAEDAGTDRIFIDMEYIGKEQRQKNMDTVQSHHTFTDVRKIRDILTRADLLVRINPIHEASAAYVSSEEEINTVIETGADFLMLPFFRTAGEVRQFTEIIGGRAKKILLLETPEAVDAIDEILKIDGIDEIHIGINDLSLGYRKKFMFEMLSDGTVERICKKIREVGIPYGFGGIASLGRGMLPAEYVIGEHYRLGSTRAILSRSFYNASTIVSLDEVSEVFVKGLQEIREFEDSLTRWSAADFEKNRMEVVRRCKMITHSM